MESLKTLIAFAIEFHTSTHNTRNNDLKLIALEKRRQINPINIKCVLCRTPNNGKPEAKQIRKLLRQDSEASQPVFNMCWKEKEVHKKELKVEKQ